MSEQAKTDREIIDQLVEALEASTEALKAWIHQYAPDQCEAESVERYSNMIAYNSGTLAFIVKQIKANKASLSKAYTL